MNQKSYCWYLFLTTIIQIKIGLPIWKFQTNTQRPTFGSPGHGGGGRSAITSAKIFGASAGWLIIAGLLKLDIVIILMKQDVFFSRKPTEQRVEDPGDQKIVFGGKMKSFSPFFQPRVENVATFMSRGGTICGQYLKSQFSGSKTFPLLIVQGTREDLIRISSLPLFYDRSFFLWPKSWVCLLFNFFSISNNLAPDGEREFRTQSAQNYGDKMTLFTKTVKVLIIFQEFRIIVSSEGGQVQAWQPQDLQRKAGDSLPVWEWLCRPQQATSQDGEAWIKRQLEVGHWKDWRWNNQ